ncbi:MAG: response regulator, partial [Nitrospirota bacterium]
VCDDCPVEKSFKDGGLHSLVKTRETDKGKEYFEIVSSTLLDSSGEIIGGIEAVRDITGRMRLEESLEFSQEYLSKIIESVPETILLVDSAGKVLDINPAGVEMGEAGSPNEIIGRSLFSFVVPEHHDSIHSFVDTVFKGEKGTIECEIITFKGNRRIISASAMTFYDRRIDQVLGVAVVRDITEHRKMEDQLAQSQKMEAIGTFTSGVAHEFNNVLTSIIGYGELMQDEIGKNAMLKTYLNAISSSAERGVNLTKGLLAYCRKQSIHLKPLLLSSVFAEVRGLIEKIIGENIELNISLPDDIAVYADRSQIEQVLINLATNARDAMPDGGVIDINVDSIEIDSDSDIVDRGSYALITFSDTGQGMDKKTLQNIFEPFFTTKDVGKGTGLGLAMAYGIIKKHNGGISVNSEPGKGTTLKIYLPKVAIPSDATAVSKKEELKGGEETILIAEDDDRVRVLIKIMLEKYGYKVIECKDGESAVNRYLTNRDKISFCILDVVMPNKNGKQVHDEIVTLDPDMKVLFISGYSADIIDTEGLIKENLNFLYKPISPSELLKKVREMLDR